MSSPPLRQLSHLCEQGELAVFTGAGISRDQPSNLPLWPDLVNNLVRDLARTDPKRRYDQIVETLIARKLPSEVVIQFIAGYDKPTCKQAVADVFAGAVPNRHHHRLAALASRISVFVTTNYDDCQEQALRARGIEFKLLISDSDFLWASEALANKTLRTPVVAKIHGHLEQSSGMVMMLSESRRGLSGAKKRFMNYLHQNKHVLFLGYSGGDLYLDDNRLLMRNAAANARGFTWVYRPDSTQSGAVDNLIELYNHGGHTKAAKVEVHLDDLFSSLGGAPGPDDKDITPAQGAGSSPAKEAHWPQNAVKHSPGLLIAEMLMHAGDLGAAENVFEDLTQSRDNSSDPLTALMAAGSLARLAQRRGEHDRALRILAECQLEKIGFSETNLSHARASLQVILAESLQVVGRVDDAISVTGEACDTFSKLADYKTLLLALGNHSNYLREKGRIAEAKEALESSLRLATQFGDVDSEAAAYNNLSLIYSQLGDQLRAIEIIDKSIKLADSICDSRGVCRNYVNRGQALNYAGRLDEAFASFKKGSELAQKTGMIADVGRAETGMGVVEFNRGAYGKAVEHWNRAMEITRQVGDFLGEMELLNNMAEVNRRVEEFDEALNLINEAIRRLDERGFSGRTGPYLHTRGMINLDQQDYPKAERDFMTAADRYSKMGNARAKASETYHAGIAVAMQQNPLKAEKLLSDAEKIQRELNDKLALANTLLFKGKVSVPLKRRDNLIACFTEGISILKAMGMESRAAESREELNYYLRLN